MFSKGAGNVLYKIDSDRLLRVRMNKEEGCIDSEQAYDGIVRQILPNLNPLEFVEVDEKKLKELDPDNTYGLSNIGQVTENLIKDYELVVEIKPKWASRPNPLTAGERESRMKLKNGFESERLFSGNSQDQIEEIAKLMDTDSKFITVFSKGEKVKVDSETVAPQVQKALQDSGVMATIKHYQLYCDPLDLQYIYPRIKDLNTDNASSRELQEAVSKIPKQGGDEATWQQLKDFGESLRSTELLYLYSLAMTLRDVSIFVRLSSSVEVKVVDADYKSLSRIHKWYASDCKLNNFHDPGTNR